MNKVISNGWFALIRKTFQVLLAAVLVISAAAGTIPAGVAQASSNYQEQVNPIVNPLIAGHVLSDGEFVYGPNVGSFDVRAYLSANAPQLEKYADDLYGRADYFSINPKVYLTLLEIHAGLISNPDPAKLEDPFHLATSGFIPQIDEISNVMVSAYYLHLYSYTGPAGALQSLPPVSAPDGAEITISPETNAGTYAIMAALALIETEVKIPHLLDNTQPDGFFQTYQRLFPDSSPTSEKNHVFYPGEAGAESLPMDLLHLQLPYLRGESWVFNGVHDAAGADVGDPLVNGAAIDFSPNWPAWGADTSNMWVVAAASGVPTKVSSCSVRVAHSDGWETGYYHLDKIPTFTGSVNQNDKIGVIANNLAQAICSGGFSTGPHLHFTLRRNGAYVAINGTPLSGWYIHSGRWNYDGDPNYMWLERPGIKKYAGNPLLSESPSLITQIAAGSAHTCALMFGGKVKCWGKNPFGQLGDGTTSDRLSPVDVVGLTSGVVNISAGIDHTCAVLNSGALKCWGSNSFGQLGDGTTIDRPTPVDVSGLSSGVMDVSLGSTHTCALKSSGAVRCWGNNTLGQLGNGTTTNSSTPVSLPDLSSGVKAISSGDEHACAITSGGAAKCWGSNAFGQLGNGTTTDSLSPVSVTSLSSGVVSISAGNAHSCAVTSTPAVKCWGKNNSGQLGDGTSIDRPTPVAPSGFTDGAAALAAGQDFTCALKSIGNVKCFGLNDAGQLGDGTTTNRLIRATVTGLTSSALSISTGGGGHTCALTSIGTAMCWGNNSNGQLGDGTLVTRLSAVNVAGLSYILGITTIGTGVGTITSNPAGISCGSFCNGEFVSGTSVTLTAAATIGSRFDGWSGGICSGSGTCTVVMDSARSVTATFTKVNFDLVVGKTGTGSGVVSSSPAGINCGSTCTYPFGINSTVTLTATASSGSIFTGWSGSGCSGTGTCVVSMVSAKSVTASFSPGYTLKVTKSGTGGGTVSSNPTGINCGSDCTEDYTNGTVVTLTASAASGSTFSGWSGGGCSGTGTCVVTMNSAATITAAFELPVSTFVKSLPTTGTTGLPTSLTLSWAPSAGAIFYKYCFDMTNDNACTSWIDNKMSTSATLNGLSPNTTYYWHVKAKNVAGVVSYSNGSSTAFWNFKTGALPSAFVKSSPANSATNQPLSLSLSWAASAGAVTYEVCHDSTNDNACTPWVNNGTSTSLLLSGLSGDTTYYWHVRAINSIGTTYANGSAIAFWSFKTISSGTGPGDFSKASPADGSTNRPLSLTIKWNTSTGASSYWYCFDQTNDGACTTWVNNGSATSAVISNLTLNATYYWQVRAVNSFGTTYAGGSSSDFWSFSVAAPAPFTKLGPANLASGLPRSLTLSWSPSTGAKNYWVCYDTSNDNACSTWVNYGLATSLTLTGLTANTTYYWHVRAVSSAGTTYSDGSSSAYWSFTTGP